jgi:hypothetical protein
MPKMFKKSSRQCVCPQCAKAMIEMGPYFEPPKQSSKRMWELLDALALTGFRFDTEDNRERVYGAARAGARVPSSRTVMLRIRALLGELVFELLARRPALLLFHRLPHPLRDHSGIVRDHSKHICSSTDGATKSLSSLRYWCSRQNDGHTETARTTGAQFGL